MKVVNKKAHFDYELGDREEVGIVLTGAEVKSVKLGQVDLGGSQCKIVPTKFGSREVWAYNIKIYPYKHADNTEYDPVRKRKLLLHQKEIVVLEGKMKTGRLLLVPSAMYTKEGLVKVEIALARGKRKYEKRETIKKRDLDREMR
jgi:SsrA-binding protein